MPHLNKVKENITKMQQKIYRISRATWGIKPKVIKEIYLKITERMIFYGKEIRFNENVAMREKLFQIQSTGLLAIAKTYKTVSTFALHLLTGCPPFDIKIKEDNEIWQQQQGIKNFEKIETSFNFDYATEGSLSPPYLGELLLKQITLE
ncbi:hypothetical protein AVEN_117809-1 [Araneus ventricosus]|uniref:Uncharacterized protein n=1 Tax=Araneus ventricosus TaxID=182803 RepID=A0A4Y2B879_ARAVE|nr:hypothetical protein AVEN_117809-1 [Araneus ventricosus]